MADSPKSKLAKTLSSSFFISPRLFGNGFSSKTLFDSSESFSMSPTSILDSKPFSTVKNPFWSDSPKPKKFDHDFKPAIHSWEPKGVGLAAIDELQFDSRTVLFGSQLKINICKPTVEYGTKTRNRSPKSRSRPGSPESSSRGFVSAEDMEMSEDYTCVISRGANPRTTHIFDDCVVETCVGLSSRKESLFFISDEKPSCWSKGFLNCCDGCRKRLDIGTDVYMYKGDLAFCSEDCRWEEMSKLDQSDVDELVVNKNKSSS